MRRKHKNERKVFVKTPTGKSKVVFKKRNPNRKTCKKCGEMLKGIKRINSFKLNKTNKSLKKNNRKFGGELCSKCSREEIIMGARGE